MFFRCLLADSAAALLCVLYRLQWLKSEPLSFLTDQLDTISAAQESQHTMIVGDLNQHLVDTAFKELTGIHGLTNHVDFATHFRESSLDPVLSNLPDDSLLCSLLHRVDSTALIIMLSSVNSA